MHYAAALAEERKSAQNSLFAMEATVSTDLVSHHLPQVSEWSPLEKLSDRFSAIGFYLSAHPLNSKQAQLERMRIIRYSEIEAKLSDRPMLRVQLAGVLLRKSEKISQRAAINLHVLNPVRYVGCTRSSFILRGLTRSRDFLEVGKSILLSADVEMKDDAFAPDRSGY